MEALCQSSDLRKELKFLWVFFLWVFLAPGNHHPVAWTADPYATKSAVHAPSKTEIEGDNRFCHPILGGWIATELARYRVPISFVQKVFHGSAHRILLERREYYRHGPHNLHAIDSVLTHATDHVFENTKKEKVKTEKTSKKHQIKLFRAILAPGTIKIVFSVKNHIECDRPRV